MSNTFANNICIYLWDIQDGGNHLYILFDNYTLQYANGTAVGHGRVEGGEGIWVAFGEKWTENLEPKWSGPIHWPCDY